MPAALYKIVRNNSAKNPHPVVVTRDVTIQTAEQASDYLLCATCEGRFNEGGENWVIPRCWHSTTSFPLRALLTVALPNADQSMAVYEAANLPDVEPDKLAYFASSLFWRAAAHDWPLNKGVVPRLRLGPYEEDLRLYLLGGSFPSNAAMIIAVGHGMEEMRNSVITLPHLAGREKGWRLYRCTVPGITFALFVGNALSPEIRRTCSVRTPARHIYSIDEIDKMNFQGAIATYARSRPVGSWASKRADTAGAPSPWSPEETTRLLPKSRRRSSGRAKTGSV
jgi:hypothetical protein